MVMILGSYLKKMLYKGHEPNILDQGIGYMIYSFGLKDIIFGFNL